MYLSVTLLIFVVLTNGTFHFSTFVFSYVCLSVTLPILVVLTNGIFHFLWLFWLFLGEFVGVGEIRYEIRLDTSLTQSRTQQVKIHNRSTKIQYRVIWIQNPNM